MNELTVTITVDADGNIRIEAHGYEGADCLSALQPLARLGTVEEEGHTADWYKYNRRGDVRQEVHNAA